jgi:hypothetical protein
VKVFVSWSGPLSHRVAVAWREWLPSVLQVVEPYVSSEDIDKGARWGSEISKELEGSSFGILCVTAENLDAPWLNFEAGALSKSFEKSCVSPFLLGLDRKDMPPGPILQFQSTIFTKDDILKLLHSINDACEEGKLSDDVLNRSFNRAWPELEVDLNAVRDDVNQGHSTELSRSNSEVMEEILDLVRSQHRILSSPAELFPLAYLENALRGPQFGVRTWRAISDLVMRFNQLADHLQGGIEAGMYPPELVQLLQAIESPIRFIARQIAQEGPPSRRPRTTSPSLDPF